MPEEPVDLVGEILGVGAVLEVDSAQRSGRDDAGVFVAKGEEGRGRGRRARSGGHRVRLRPLLRPGRRCEGWTVTRRRRRVPEQQRRRHRWRGAVRIATAPRYRRTCGQKADRPSRSGPPTECGSSTQSRRRFADPGCGHWCRTRTSCSDEQWRRSSGASTNLHVDVEQMVMYLVSEPAGEHQHRPLVALAADPERDHWSGSRPRRVSWRASAHSSN